MDKTLADTLTAWRHHLHAHPELTLHEKETAAFVCAKLRELGVPFVAGVGGHGIVATISRGQSNRSVGLRADMDALPISETTGLAYASGNPGVMHACGHDGHTTSLLGAAALLQQDTSWTGTVHLVFQPAEEGGGGAKSMIADGLFERFPMERIFGYHNWPGLDAGTVAVHDAAVMASGGRIEFRVKGRSGHAALPHLTRDPMVASAHLLLALQTIVSRNVDPLDAVVITVATMEAGSAANQIPGEAFMRGTMRTLRDEVCDAVEDGDPSRRGRGGAELRRRDRRGAAPRQSGDREHAGRTRPCGGSGAWRPVCRLRRDMPPAMTGEDFAWYLQQRPGAFVWIGNGPAEDGRGLHSSSYDYNDAILPAAADYLAGVARRALGS